jgi:hypothetical protein
MTEFIARIHRFMFGFHNGELAHQYQSAARALAVESRLFRQQLFALRQTSADPLRDLIRIREAR